MNKIALHWQILIAMLLAIICGLLSQPTTTIFGISLIAALNFIATLFLNALKMVVIPLIIASIISSIGGIRDNATLKRLGAKTIALYLCSSVLAILVGLFWVNLLSPGTINGEAAGITLNLHQDANAENSLAKIKNKDSGDIAEVFIRLVPENIFSASAEGALLGVIFFSLLYAIFMRRSSRENLNIQRHFWDGVYSTMLAMTMWIISFAPIGVFALISKTIINTGFAAFVPLLTFLICVFLALLTHIMLTLPLLLRVLAKIHPLKHYRAMLPALLTAFSTASSSATLPLTMKYTQSTGVSQSTSSFVLPLGATINMDGTALYECVAALFIAQAYGLDLSLSTQFYIVSLALFTSIGVAGIPAASLVAITIILTAVGLPVEGIGLLLITDRILDMLRTAVNVLGDSCCAAIIAKREGESLVTALNTEKHC